MNKYKIPWHIKQFCKQELMDYPKNKKAVEKWTGSTRTLIAVEERVTKIENVLNTLSEEDLRDVETIFFERYTQAGAETAKGLSKTAYYNAMNKVIYMVAVEMGLT